MPLRRLLAAAFAVVVLGLGACSSGSGTAPTKGVPGGADTGGRTPGGGGGGTTPTDNQPPGGTTE